MTRNTWRASRSRVALWLIGLTAPLGLPRAGGCATVVDRGASALQAGEFAGRWEYRVDDGTYEERLDVRVTGDEARGTLEGFQHGYFSGRTTSTGVVHLQGVVRNGRVDMRIIGSGGVSGSAVEMFRRGDYLVIRGGGRTTGYARPGTPLVRSADGSSEAAALARAISGHVYRVGAQANGRGAFVGGRLRFAFCANGEMEYDESDLASTPGSTPGGGADLGSTTSRRGQWSIVMYAGAPAVMAKWRGTGTSYSLTAYYDLTASANGDAIELNGRPIPSAGRC